MRRRIATFMALGTIAAAAGFIVSVGLAAAEPLPANKPESPLTAAIRKLDLRVLVDDIAAAEARRSPRRDASERIKAANRADSAEWYTIKSARPPVGARRSTALVPGMAAHVDVADLVAAQFAEVHIADCRDGATRPASTTGREALIGMIQSLHRPDSPGKFYVTEGASDAATVVRLTLDARRPVPPRNVPGLSPLR